MDEEVLAEAAYVVSSHYRSEVMIALDNVIETPTSISKKTNIKLKYVSRALTELKNRGIVECINEEAYQARLYELTDLGEQVFEKLLIFNLIDYNFT